MVKCCKCGKCGNVVRKILSGLSKKKKIKKLIFIMEVQKKIIDSNFLGKLNNSFFIHIDQVTDLNPKIPESLLHSLIIDFNTKDNTGNCTAKCIDLIRFQWKYIPSWIVLISHSMIKTEFEKKYNIKITDAVGVFVYQKIK